MIVECENCSTRFQLDDERIPITGIRVRCSRCKQAFYLQHPASSQQQTVDALAASAVEDAAPAVPEPATDLAGSTLQDLEDDGSTGVVDEDEEDWEFNHEVPEPELAAEPAEPSVLNLAESGQFDPAESGAFGSVDDFGALADEEMSEVETAAAADVTTSALESDIADVISSLSTLNVDDSAPSSDASVNGDIGEPEEWDLLGEESPEPSTEAVPASTTPAPVRSPVVQPEPRLAAPQTARRVEPARPARRGGLALVGSVVGWLAFAGLLVGALAQGMAGSFAEAPAADAYPVGSLVADAVETGWLTVGGGETLLVVRGVLHNPAPSAQVVGVSLAVELLDAAGRPLDHPVGLAGRPLQPDALRTLAPGARAARMTAAATALSGERIAGGGQIEFAAYFARVPADASRVAVHAQEIAPGADVPNS